MNPIQTPKITIDTNCVIGLFDTKSQTATSTSELRELVRYAFSGAIELYITTRVEVDFGRDKDDQRREEMLKNISMFPVIGTVSRWNVSTWDSSDISIDLKRQKLADEVQRIIFPGLTPTSSRYANKLADIDHLVGHALSGHDVFITDDGEILRRSSQLEGGIGIRVMRPAECLRFVDDYYTRHQKKSLTPSTNNAAYRDKRLRGTVNFDYSNNDHRFSIGDGLYLFETRWSKASDTSIYAYRDGSSVEAIALARNASEIHHIIDATIYDFSSRVRCPQLGQIIVWRNVNGLYAATKIVTISDDMRGAACDELTFEFVILPDGATSFLK